MVYYCYTHITKPHDFLVRLDVQGTIASNWFRSRSRPSSVILGMSEISRLPRPRWYRCTPRVTLHHDHDQSILGKFLDWNLIKGLDSRQFSSVPLWSNHSSLSKDQLYPTLSYDRAIIPPFRDIIFRYWFLLIDWQPIGIALAYHPLGSTRG